MRLFWTLLIPLPCAWAQPLLLEQRETAVQSQPLIGPGFEIYSLFILPVPKAAPEHSLVRLRIPGRHRRIWVDGAAIPAAADQPGEFDLLNLPPRRPGRAVAAGETAAAVLIETPRVLVTQWEIGTERARVWVRNSLDNTVNVTVRISSPGDTEGAIGDATVPPGVTQVVTVPGVAGLQRTPWRISLDKQEEAMEGAYRFVLTAHTRTGPTVNSYDKP